MLPLMCTISAPSPATREISPGGHGLDTSLDYGSAVQRRVGNAVRSSGLSREKVFATTKMPCCPFIDPTGSAYEPQSWCQNISSASVPQEMSRSLSEIGLTRVDLMLLHWPCATFRDTLATWRLLERMVQENKTRAIGISNFNASQIRPLLKSAAIKPAVNQCGFSIGNHDDRALGGDNETRRLCSDSGIVYQAYSPLGGLSKIDVLRDQDVARIAAKHQVSAAQVALRWVVQQGALLVTSATNAEYMREDLDVFSFELTAPEMVILDAK